MRRPWRWLERAGLGSYSLYLVHLPTLIVLYSLVGDVDPWVGWVLQWAVVFAVAWLFHRTVERPAHSLARGLGRRMRQVRPAT
jgi:peptidoglycan/LPS O-acetylase OafA/YrhL